MTKKMKPEDVDVCESVYQAMGGVLDTFEDHERFNPELALAVVAKMYASIGDNIGIDKKSLLSYVAQVIDDTYYDNQTDNDGKGTIQ
jgi:hypothetical protein